MSASTDRRPVPRIRVLGGAICLFAVLGLVVLTGEVLRHPHPATGSAATIAPAADPRLDASCEIPLPREGDRRAPAGDVTATVEVASSDLYDCPHNYDGRRVRYTGEVVGALLPRDIGVWTQLNDDVYAGTSGPLPTHQSFRGGNSGVGALLHPTHAALVDAIGGPGLHGDVLEIEGIFHRVDPTGEVAVIRADTTRVVVEGAHYAAPALNDRRVVAVVAVLLAGAVVAAERMVARRR